MIAITTHKAAAVVQNQGAVAQAVLADDHGDMLRGFAMMLRGARSPAEKLEDVANTVSRLLGAGKHFKPELIQLSSGVLPQDGQLCVWVEIGCGMNLHVGSLNDQDEVQFPAYGQNEVASLAVSRMIGWFALPTSDVRDASASWVSFSSSVQPGRTEDILVIDQAGQFHIGQLKGKNFFFPSYGQQTMEFVEATNLSHFMPMSLFKESAMQALQTLEA
ncbi:hypothetical protein HNP46_000266 [Pseudomonas nitritireducens]|uniref:Uncharacterized protein n=1 Tax=Pseudomonas nitroreducens TaxID=46680 RepID=A0A7W7NZM3_PSENT|nr:hypothetical protein [Pseudomonas nitritireducens]MBB4861455.1 hypothetical protein [Pseudomonas nitritireducens]